MALPTLQGIELFSGVGMLGEGLRAGLDYLGLAYRTVCHVEREAYAASVLVARMEEGSMDAAPVWSDVCTFDARAWRGKVDCVVAGFPCQDLSVAGKRAGLDGKRSGLFFEVTRIADDSGAWFIVLENVAGIASATATVMDEEEGELDERAAARVVGELADLGWDAEWITLSASDVGANHGRARWFCIAWKLDNATSSRRDGARQRTATDVEGGECVSGEGFAALDNAGRVQRRAGHEQDRSRSAEASGNKAHNWTSDRSIDVGNPNEQREQQSWVSDVAISRERSRDCSCRSSGDLADSARHLGDGQGRQSGRGRRVCEAGNELAEPSRIGRHQGRPESGGEQGRFDASERCVSVADACNTGQQGSELGRALPCDRGGQEAHGSTSQLCGLFAPGPADPSWGAIIAAEPYRAPALEPTFRGVVNGLAFDMGDCRAPRLKCGGNGVVALCAAVAVVELFRRAGIMSSIIADMAITRRAA